VLNKNILTFIFSLATLAATADKATAEALRWAADAESGAPYVYTDPENPESIIGFEKDIIEALAKHLKREPIFVQNSWDGLVPGLERGSYDVAINGIEITDERRGNVLFSTPYYATELQLVVRAEDARFQSLEDLAGFKVGTLNGALTEKILRHDPSIQILPYESEVAAHEDLALKRSDAVFFDAPIAKYYSSIDPRFKILPHHGGSAIYGIAIAKGQNQLLNEVNVALKLMIHSGELRAIYESWGIWNASTAQLLHDDRPSRAEATQFEAYKRAAKKNQDWWQKIVVYKNAVPLLLQGAWTTLRISFVSMLLAIVGGLLLVLARTRCPAGIKYLATLYIEVIRGTPLLLQLFFIFYGLPHFGIELSPYWAAVWGLGLNYAAQECEIYRSGLASVHRNQIEAGKVLGFSKVQIFWHIECPQALRVILPPMTTDFIALIKDSSLVSVITMVELTKTYTTLAATYFDYIGFAIAAAALYIGLGLPFVLLSKHWERRFSMHA
jgi:polar amino acid transport system substrate-binding protein